MPFLIFLIEECLKSFATHGALRIPCCNGKRANLFWVDKELWFDLLLFRFSVVVYFLVIELTLFCVFNLFIVEPLLKNKNVLIFGLDFFGFDNFFILLIPYRCSVVPLPMSLNISLSLFSILSKMPIEMIGISRSLRLRQEP